MSNKALLLRQESADSSAAANILPNSPSLSSLNRLRDTFRRTESLSSQLSAAISNAASAASGAVLGTNQHQASEASSASTSQVSSPVKKRKPGECIPIWFTHIHCCMGGRVFRSRWHTSALGMVNWTRQRWKIASTYKWPLLNTSCCYEKKTKNTLIKL